MVGWEELERSGCGLIEIFRDFSVGTEKNHGNLSEKPVFRPLFQPGNSQVHI
jgi:hypothetical protein